MGTRIRVGGVAILLSLLGAAPVRAPRPAVPGPCDPEVIDLGIEPVPSPVEERRAFAAKADASAAFVAAEDMSSITKVDLATGQTSTYALADAQVVDATLANGDQTLIVTDDLSNTVRFLSAETGETLATVALDESPTRVTAEGDRVYVSLATKVRVLDTSGQFVGDVALPAPGPVTPSDGRLFIPIPSSGMLVLVDMATLAVVDQRVVGTEPVSVAVCDRALVADRAGNRVAVVNPQTLAVERSVAVERPAEIGTTADFAFIRTNGTIAILDCATGRIDCEIVLGSAAEGVAAVPAANRLVAATRQGTRLIVIAPECLTNDPRIDSMDRSSGLPGAFLRLTGQFPADTSVAVEWDPAGPACAEPHPRPFVASPCSRAADGGTMTVQFPLDAPRGAAWRVSVTRSTAEAILAGQPWIRCTPQAFATDTIRSSLGRMIHEAGEIEDMVGLERQQQNRARQAGRHLEQALHAFGQGAHNQEEGDIEDALEHENEALAHLADGLAEMDRMGDLGMAVGSLPVRVAEAAQYMAHLDIADFRRDVGLGEREGEIVSLFEDARALLCASPDETSALAAMVNYEEISGVLGTLPALPIFLSKYQEECGCTTSASAPTVTGNKRQGADGGNPPVTELTVTVTVTVICHPEGTTGSTICRAAIDLVLTFNESAELAGNVTYRDHNGAPQTRAASSFVGGGQRRFQRVSAVGPEQTATVVCREGAQDVPREATNTVGSINGQTGSWLQLVRAQINAILVAQGATEINVDGVNVSLRRNARIEYVIRGACAETATEIRRGRARIRIGSLPDFPEE